MTTWLKDHWRRLCCWERLKAKGEGVAKDEMVRSQHWFKGHEFEETPGDSGGQGSLVCCSPWGCKELDIAAAAAAKSPQSCPTLCDPIDGSPPGSPVPGILQARTLEWVAISFSNAWKWRVTVKSLSRVWLLATPWTAAYQAPPSMGEFPGKSTGVGCYWTIKQRAVSVGGEENMNKNGCPPYTEWNLSFISPSHIQAIQHSQRQISSSASEQLSSSQKMERQSRIIRTWNNTMKMIKVNAQEKIHELQDHRLRRANRRLWKTNRN